MLLRQCIFVVAVPNPRFIKQQTKTCPAITVSIYQILPWYDQIFSTSPAANKQQIKPPVN